MYTNLPLFNRLLEMESYLKKLDLWSLEEPSHEALSSKAPFALDTLTPEQWLQWIFLPKMMQLLENDQVPQGFSVSPYFEEVWRLEDDKKPLLQILNAIDEVCQ